MELFFTNPLLVQRRPLGYPGLYDETVSEALEIAISSTADAPVPVLMPFLLSGPAQYNHILNEFFRRLPSDGCPATNTWRGYALDIWGFSRFLLEFRHGRKLLDATGEDIEAYYAARRTGEEKVEAVTWNRSVAALQRFYDWALGKQLISRSPFEYRLRSWGPKAWLQQGAPARNTAYERANSDSMMRFVSVEEYLIFRNIGLLGLSADGGIDPAFRGRNRLRNAAYAEMMIVTGMRLEEQTSLLLHELPDPRAERWRHQNSVRFSLAPPTTKGHKGRTIWLFKRVLTDYVLPYAVEEREGIVDVAHDIGGYDGLEHPIEVTRWRQRVCDLSRAGVSSRALYSKLDPTTRSSLYEFEDGRPRRPGSLWLGEDGTPLKTNSVEKFFERASERCKKFGYDIWITPHMLRHTFAITTLTNLMRETLRIAGVNKDDTGSIIYRKLIADPLRILRDMMGHESITTTYKYLRYVEDTAELIDAAVGGWNDKLGYDAGGVA